MTDLEIILTIAVIILAALVLNYRAMASQWRDEHAKLADEWNRATLKHQSEKTRAHGRGWLTRNQRKAERRQRMAQEFGEFSEQVYRERS